MPLVFPFIDTTRKVKFCSSLQTHSKFAFSLKSFLVSPGRIGHVISCSLHHLGLKHPQKTVTPYSLFIPLSSLFPRGTFFRRKEQFSFDSRHLEFNKVRKRLGCKTDCFHYPAIKKDEFETFPAKCMQP